MRPRIVACLESLFGTGTVDYLVPTGTVALCAAILAVLWVMIERGRRVGLSRRDIIGSSAAGVVGGLIGSRLFVLVQHLPNTLAHPEVLLNPSGGTASWGGYSLGTLCFVLFLARRRQPILAHADLLASALGLGPFLARWGCFLNGCCFGRPSDLPWAVAFPRHSFAYSAQLREGLIGPEAPLSVPVHPVQIYASLAGLALFLAASRFWKTYQGRAGATLAFYWLLYGLLRFGTEFFRGDVPRYGALTLSQILSLGLVALVAAAFGVARRRRPGRGT